jgi:hypothetical protein
MVIGVGLVACVGGPVTTRVEELRTAFNPLVGQHKDAVLLKLGPPTENFRTDSVEVWRYRIPHGTVNTRTESYEEFDQYDFTMIRDTVSNFRVRVIR